MKKVIYFLGGTVADFAIPEERFEEFSKHVKWEIRHSEAELDKARLVLERFVGQGDGTSGPLEMAAACFVWSFFNTNPEDEKYIKGDIVIVDLRGDGATVEYASAADIQVAPDD